MLPMRWQLRLAEMHFSIAHKKGTENHHADALCRLLTKSPTVGREDDDDVPAFTLESDHSRSTNCDSPDLAEEIKFFEPYYDPVDELLATQ